MRSALIPVLALVVIPALYAGWRLALYRRIWVRWLGAAALLGVIAWSWPVQGVDLLYLKRLDFVLAGAFVLLLLVRYWRIRGWTSRRLRWALAALSGLALVVYLNFFSFHGARTFLHLHDLANYYLGSKYYAELGYSGLYTAMLRAEAEVYDNHFKAIEARDLNSYDRVHIRQLLQQSGPVKAAFSPQRWADFKRDVAFFREALGAQYGAVLLDHGFNPTPVWALLGGALSRWVPAGSGFGIALLTLIDPLLLALMFGAVAWAFGLEAMLLALGHFSLIFGATFGWTGGSMLRFLWLFGVVVGVCCLRRRRYRSAGALLALATLLRVFPLLFLAPLAFKAVALGWRRRSLAPRYRQLFGSFLATALVLVALTGAMPRGLRHWSEFRSKLSVHMETISPNIVGLTQILAFRPGDGMVTNEEFRAIKRDRRALYYAQLLLIFAPLALLVGWMSRRRQDAGAAVLAVPLLFAGLNLASYYYAFLILLSLQLRHRPRLLALVFGLEAASYGLLLFEDREALLYLYRSVLVLYLLLALFGPAARRAAGELVQAARKASRQM